MGKRRPCACRTRTARRTSYRSRLAECLDCRGAHAATRLRRTIAFLASAKTSFNVMCAAAIDTETRGILRSAFSLPGREVIVVESESQIGAGLVRATARLMTPAISRLMRAAPSAGVSPPHKRASDDAADDRPSFRRRFRPPPFCSRAERTVGGRYSLPVDICRLSLPPRPVAPQATTFEEVRHKGMPLPEVRPGVRDDILARHGSEFISGDTRPSVTGAHDLKASALIRSISRMLLERTCNRQPVSIGPDKDI